MRTEPRISVMGTHTACSRMAGAAPSRRPRELTDTVTVAALSKLRALSGAPAGPRTTARRVRCSEVLRQQQR